MATGVLVKKSLVLAIQEGMDANGKSIVKRYAYSNIDVGATPTNLYETAQAIASLSKGTVVEYTAVDTSALLQ